MILLKEEGFQELIKQVYKMAKIRVTQIKSNDCIKGMIKKVKHLVVTEDIN